MNRLKSFLVTAISIIALLLFMWSVYYTNGVTLIITILVFVFLMLWEMVHDTIYGNGKFW